MINLVKLHFSYLFSWKIIYINLISILFCLVVFVYLSNFYYNNTLLAFYSDFYNEEYIFSVLTLIKIVVLLQSMFIVINGFIINKYDVYLLIRSSRTRVITTKIATILIGTSLFTVTLFLLFNIVGLYLTPYYEFKNTHLELLFDLVLFNVVYCLLYILLVTIIKNMYSLILVYILYFISDISVEYLVQKDNLSFFTKTINLIFPGIGFYSEIGFDLFYSKLYYLSLSALIVQVIITLYRKTDITN